MFELPQTTLSRHIRDNECMPRRLEGLRILAEDEELAIANRLRSCSGRVWPVTKRRLEEALKNYVGSTARNVACSWCRRGWPGKKCATDS
jgi:hypothetical protein